MFVCFLIQHDGGNICQPKSLSSHCSHQSMVGDIEADRVRKKISPMFQTSSKKTKVGPVLEALQSLCDEDLNADDVCKRLEDLALEQKFTVTYLDLPEISLSGNILSSFQIFGGMCGFNTCNITLLIKVNNIKVYT